MTDLVEIYWKGNGPRQRWEKAPSVIVGHLFSPNFRRKYVLDNGVEFTREVGEPLFDDEGNCPEWDK